MRSLERVDGQQFEPGSVVQSEKGEKENKLCAFEVAKSSLLMNTDIHKILYLSFSLYINPE